jgi:hypothetical protein
MNKSPAAPQGKSEPIVRDKKTVETVGFDGKWNQHEVKAPPLQPCKHILVPGKAHCRTCGEQILFTGLERAQTSALDPQVSTTK